MLESGAKWLKMVDKSKKSGSQRGFIDVDGSKSEVAPMEEGPQLGFYGNYEHSIDSKGRVALPASFRSLLKNEDSETIVLTNFITGGARCLDGFSLSAWREFETKIRQKSRFDPALRQFETFYIARATLCTWDSNGRINIPQYLRDYAGIDKNLVFTAALHGFRVWRKEVWNLVFTQSEEELLDNPALFEGVDL